MLRPGQYTATRFASTTLRSPPAATVAYDTLVSTAAGKLSFDASKAGLQKVDKMMVQRTIEEASKGSAFYNNEQRNHAERQRKNSVIVAKAHQYAFQTSAQVRRETKKRAQAVEDDLESTRSFDRCYIHIDMDMFYAAVEQKLNPELAEVPFAVGSWTMLSTSNYIARGFGVRSGMPGFIAKKLCPQLRIVPTNFDAYREEAACVREIGRKYDLNTVSVGLDELTMDVTAYLKVHPTLTPAEVCESFRQEVFQRTCLTCSGGVAHTPAFAKMACGKNKPNGQHVLSLRCREDVLAFVRDIPIREFPGIGYAQESTLHALGIRVAHDMLRKKELLYHLFREKTFLFYLSVGLGLVRHHSERVLAATTTENTSSDGQQRKSLSKEKTFSKRLKTAEEMTAALTAISSEAHGLLIQENLTTQCVTVILKNRKFERQTLQKRLGSATNDFKVILGVVLDRAAKAQLAHEQVKLIGVLFTSLQSGHHVRAAKGPTLRSTTVNSGPRVRKPLMVTSPRESKNATKARRTTGSRSRMS